ncbi:MAG: magnesium-translocating P-type ATPase [Thermogemmatispora sp.]|uniref:magnesium-translocating P-type ATPase n=1 Tax=Thermogemmatispora sp. TaxID=1968838 RepID=UPI001A051989|nr:magnesium-translocating P-type ATPase [Thermogemmatispora sp.]MBE3567345.1 magnesium-translocating P-type ATPase [Thermogemmatispora sp.]
MPGLPPSSHREPITTTIAAVSPRYSQSLSQLLTEVRSSEQGLTEEEARRRLRQFGPNEVAAERTSSGVAQLVRLFLNPLVAVLLLASLVSALLGELTNALIIAIIVLLSLVLNFLQSYRSQRAVERLRSSVAPVAHVLRDGHWQDLPRRLLVPGDVIRLAAGDLVPADARLIEALDLHVQQAALTGESLPVAKRAEETATTLAHPAEAPNWVFLGTSVVSGSALALVVATGPRTAFGDVAIRLAQRPPETEFERGLRRFSFLILETVFFLTLFVFLTGVLLHHPLFESVLFALALAVGLTPEFLPMIVTITLGQGAVRMARRKVIVKHLEAIQNFGSIDILCTDKTGTLTRGEMTLQEACDLRGQASERTLFFAYLNSALQTGFNSPLDQAIQRSGAFSLAAYRKCGEIPFDFERRRLSVIVEQTNTARRLLIVKGAPEHILPLCTGCELDGVAQPLTAALRGQAEALHQRFSQEGLRVLAVAYRELPQQERYGQAEEQDLILLGLLTFVDPPQAGVAEAIAALARDGVQVKIVTGDNELVARHICRQVGLDPARVLVGSQLERMSDAALLGAVEHVTLFARVSPAQKSRILLALKRRGHVVGFLGDGINDAPSLHAADVGISVAGAVDIAREAASILLLEQSLQVLHAGILEGRRAFGNVMKYLLMGTSSNFGNVFSMAGAFLLLPFLPMLPAQILLNNFLYDLAQVTIPTDHVDASLMLKPQRWNIGLIRNFMLLVGPISSLYDFLTFFVMLAVFHASEALFHTGWFIESLATQTLVIFVIRTAGHPLRSRPSLPLTLTTLAVVGCGLLLPWTPLAAPLGFVPLPAGYFLFLAVATLTYLALVELVKGRLLPTSQQAGLSGQLQP